MVELRSCPRVACNDIKTFNVTLPSVQGKGNKARRPLPCAPPLHPSPNFVRCLTPSLQAAKPGETLVFSADDNRELIAWANDLTKVWKALAPHAS